MNQTEIRPVRKRWSGINGNTLKLLAIILMVTDHIGAVLIEEGILNYYGQNILNMPMSQVQANWWNDFDFVLRTLGRPAFPIFCFLLVEGFVHTRNVKKYIGRMAVFAFVSEIPFDLALYGVPFDFRSQNVYFTLLIGLLVLYGMSKNPNNGWGQALSFLAGCGAAYVLRTDYEVVGILLITAFYLLHDNKMQRTVLCGGISAYESWMCYGAGALALVPIWFYNGERGKLRLKYLFYWFYPVHLMILYLIRFTLVT